jgi:hypothetical protein
VCSICTDIAISLEVLTLVQAYEPLGQGRAPERVKFTRDISDHWEEAAGLVLDQPCDKTALAHLDECNRLFSSAACILAWQPLKATRHYPGRIAC